MLEKQFLLQLNAPLSGARSNTQPWQVGLLFQTLRNTYACTYVIHELIGDSK